MDAVMFTDRGPKVGTDTSLNIGSGASGDLFYTACAHEGTYVVAASEDSNFAQVTGRPDAQACADAATQRPTRKRTPFPALRTGTSFCLLGNFGRHQLVLVTLTRISGRDLGWTATAWLDRDG
jgi:hypothetical protein